MPRARSKFTDTNRITIGTDDGIVLMSMTEAEKQKLLVTLNDTQFNDISDMSITAKLREGNNTGLGTVPTAIDDSAAVFDLTVLDQADSVAGTNTFQLYFNGPSITDTFTLEPTVGKPSYAFLSVTIDEGADSHSQSWEILRGQVEILKSIGA